MTQNPLSQISIENYLGQTEINSINGFEFEKLVGELLNRMGLNVQLTKKSGDGGIDIIAISDSAITGGKYVIQCKRYASKVGEPQIRDLYGVVHHENASKGILITNSDFTQQARIFAQGKPLELIDGVTLGKLLNQYELSFGADIQNSTTMVLEVPKGHVELAKNFLRLMEEMEIKLSEMEIVLLKDKTIYLSKNEYLDFIGKALGEEFSVLLNQLVVLFNDINSQATKEFSPTYIKSRVDIINQVINAHLNIIKSLRHNSINIKEIPFNPQIYEDYKQAVIEVHKDYLYQVGAYFKQFQQIIDLDGKTVEIGFIPKISLVFEPKLNADNVLRIQEQIVQEWNIYNKKISTSKKSKQKKGLFGLF